MEYLDKDPVDVLLCDYIFDYEPHADGLTRLRKIRLSAPVTRIIFLSAYAEPSIIADALRLGAAGFIGKGTADFANLPQAIRDAHIGNIYLSPSLSALMLRRLFDRKAKPTGIDNLSERELQIVRMIHQGMSIGEIADRECRSPKTISNQKQSAMKKLGVNNDVQLIQLFDHIDKY
ncbi:response regulator transcription factor [Herbaspirillum frisingense]|nr:response regulator transcription factor [Herbaspirillum frisingense]